MTAIWNKADLCDGFSVVLVCVNKLLRYEVLGFVVAGELDIQVCKMSVWPKSSHPHVHIPVGTCMYVRPW
jgi:hypothetical protein